MSSKKNPELYRQLSLPFESREAAVKALAAFWDELYALREKHRLRDVYVVVAMSWTQDGDEGESIVPLQIGDPQKAEAMVAFAHGLEQGERQRRVEGLLTAGKKRGAE